MGVNQTGKLLFTLMIIVVLVSAFILLYPLVNQDMSIRSSPSPSTLTEELSLACQREEEVQYDMAWALLPNEIQELTYKTGVRSAAESKYQLNLLKTSSDCRYTPVLVELIARGGGAYKEGDYRYRSLFILDNQEETIAKITDIPTHYLLDRTSYGSDIWEGNSYKFVLGETEKKGEFIKRHYTYSVETGVLEDEVMQN